MSSRAPSRAAIDRAINGPTQGTCAPSSGRPIREGQPTERAQYMSEERHEREHVRHKPKTVRQNQENRAPNIDKAVFTSRQIDLSTSKSTPALDLTPQNGRVLPLSVRPNQNSRTGRRVNISNDDIMIQASSFTNSPQGSYGSRQQEKRHLTSAQAAELIQRRQKSVAQDLFPANDRNIPEGEENPSDDWGRVYNEQSDHDAVREAVNDNSSSPFQYPDAGGESRSGAYTSAGKRSRQTEVDELDNDESIHGEPEQTRKRARITVNGNDEQDHDDSDWRNPVKVRPSNGRVAAKDYEVPVQEILKVAIGLFRSHLTAEHAYPDRISQVTWAKEAWVDACGVCDAQINFNNEIIQLITNRTWHLTSELKMKIRPLVEAVYGFESSSSKPTVQAWNRKLVEELTEDFGLCYSSLGDPDNNVPRKGLYENKIIQRVINVAFYIDKKDEGVLYPQYFQPFPIAGMALILTVIEACIDEWSSGERCDIPFNEPIYRPVYNLHLSQLRKFEERTKDHAILPKLLKRFNDYGRRHARVITPINETLKRGLQDDAIAAAIREFEMQNGNLSDDK